MRHWLMIIILGLGLAVGLRGAQADAKQLAAKGHNLFLQVLAGDKEKLPLAVSVMEQSREADPAYVFNLYNLGRIYTFSAFTKRDPEGLAKAEKVFAKIVEVDPANSRALAFHGSALTALSGGRDLAKFFQGVQEMRKAIEMAPDEVNNRIVFPFTALNFPPEALKAIGNYDPLTDMELVSRVFDGKKFYYAPHADVVMKSLVADVYLQRQDAAKARSLFESALAVPAPEAEGARAGRKVLDDLITERMNGGQKSLFTSVMGTCHACHLSAPEKLLK